jgi:hypothetical protein
MEITLKMMLVKATTAKFFIKVGIGWKIDAICGMNGNLG